MKLLIALATVFSISATSAEWTCDDCTAVVNSMAAYLTTEESIAKQVDILLADVCPMDENPEDCIAELPDFWTALPWSCGQHIGNLMKTGCVLNCVWLRQSGNHL
eukprot:TRINITY_DN4631_c0_g1_i1.p1 TRINITY_DN4631_c0_g1~~TRINITY_DN4631_c0_g1_i1.p1  ORF type:complete len:105 (-),score=29.62 TRINITY_DN4631_c0_g1_i1:367-681(-)